MRQASHLAVIIALCVCACHGADNETNKTAELTEAFYKAETIDEKFDLYERVYDSERPPNLSLAPPLAGAGDPAFFVALERAQTSESLSTIRASLEVIGLFTHHFGRRCSNEDEDLIRRNIIRLTGEDNSTALIESLRFSCRPNYIPVPIIQPNRSEIALEKISIILFVELIAACLTVLFTLAVAKRLVKRSRILYLLISTLFVPSLLICSCLGFIVAAGRNQKLGELSSFVAPALFWFAIFVLPVTFVVSYLCLRLSRPA